MNLRADESTPAARRRRGLEAQADAARARIAKGLDALVERKRMLFDPADELRRHPKAALVLAGTAAVLVATGVGVVAYRRSTRKERARRERRDAWVRLVTPPERVSLKPRGFLLGMLASGASAALTATLAAVARHFVTRLLDAPSAAPRPGGPRAEPDPFPPPAPAR